MERSGSVLDQFRTAEKRVAERLRELKPLVEEYRELEQVATPERTDAPFAGASKPMTVKT